MCFTKTIDIVVVLALILGVIVKPVARDPGQSDTAYSSLFQPISAYSSLFQPIPAYSGLFQPVPTYSSLFQAISV